MYKALITDVDGTLIINSLNGLPTLPVQQAISKAQKLIHIGIATSRPMFLLERLFKTVPFSGPCIVSGGSQIYDATSKKIVYNKPLEISDAEKIIKILKPHCKKILVNDGGEGDVIVGPGFKPVMPLGVCVQGINEKLADELVSEISNLPEVSIHKLTSHKGAHVVDIDATHALATKQHGILKVAELLDIDPKEIIGVGDGYNDFPLLMACGLRVAMGNAVDDLKAIADYVAPSVDDDGLAHVIEKFVLSKNII